jgi:hypothetical protein
LTRRQSNAIASPAAAATSPATTLPTILTDASKSSPPSASAHALPGPRGEGGEAAGEAGTDDDRRSGAQTVVSGQPDDQAKDEAAADVDEQGAVREIAARSVLYELVDDIAQDRATRGCDGDRQSEHQAPDRLVRSALAT